MLKALAFGLGAGAAIQAWRAWPADSAVQADSLALVFCCGLVVSYFAGRFSARGGARATATATATAVADATSTATNSVQLAVFMPGHGAGSAPGVSLPSEAAPWLDQSAAAPELVTLDQLDGMDLEELLEQREHESG